MRNTNLGPDLARLEPRESCPCDWCDGQGEVEVAAILTCRGQAREVSSWWGRYRPSVKCPRCDGRGAEPEPDPYDGRRDC